MVLLRQMGASDKENIDASKDTRRQWRRNEKREDDQRDETEPTQEGKWTHEQKGGSVFKASAL